MRPGWSILLAVVTGAMGYAAAQVSGDYRPHPSHVPPVPQTLPAPAPKSDPTRKLLHSTQPEYPARASAFNVQAVIEGLATVNPDGSVRHVEVRSEQAEFAASTRAAVESWRFEPRPVESLVRIQVPFRMPPGEKYPHGTDERHIESVPTAASDLKGKPVVGYAYVRVMIDRNGKVVDRYVRLIRPAAFTATADMIVDAVVFGALSDESLVTDQFTVNELLVDYAGDGVIRIQQRGGGAF